MQTLVELAPLIKHGIELPPFTEGSVKSDNSKRSGATTGVSILRETLKEPGE